MEQNKYCTNQEREGEKMVMGLENEEGDWVADAYAIEFPCLSITLSKSLDFGCT